MSCNLLNSSWVAEMERASSVLCDTKVRLRLKEKFIEQLLYGTKCWAVKHQHENKLM